MTAAELKASAQTDAAPPPGLSREVQALWHAKKGNWEQSHTIAQDIHTRLGSWIHALLHLIEGDIGNANYWFAKAGKPAVKAAQIDDLWEAIAAETLPAE
jgi:hypothetical protein